jgi:predicted nucleic acid-binding protein
VLNWLGSLREASGVASVSVAELLTGVRALPTGRRRDVLLESIESALSTFACNVLPYDNPAARAYARLQELRRAAGRPVARGRGRHDRRDLYFAEHDPRDPNLTVEDDRRSIVFPPRPQALL